MDSNVKVCVDARLNMFETYYTVPEELAGEVESFRQELTRLGEQSPDAGAFEAAFAGGGYDRRFNDLLVRCKPKAYKMTREEKDCSKEVREEMYRQNKSEIKKHVVGEVADTVLMHLESDLISAKRKSMIESGTMDEYTKVSNALEDTGWLAGKIGKLFGKK